MRRGHPCRAAPRLPVASVARRSRRSRSRNGRCRRSPLRRPSQLLRAEHRSGARRGKEKSPAAYLDPVCAWTAWQTDSGRGRCWECRRRGKPVARQVRGQVGRRGRFLHILEVGDSPAAAGLRRGDACSAMWSCEIVLLNQRAGGVRRAARPGGAAGLLRAALRPRGRGHAPVGRAGVRGHPEHEARRRGAAVEHLLDRVVDVVERALRVLERGQPAAVQLEDLFEVVAGADDRAVDVEAAEDGLEDRQLDVVVGGQADEDELAAACERAVGLLERLRADGGGRSPRRRRRAPGSRRSGPPRAG